MEDKQFKICFKCKKSLALEYFKSNKTRKDQKCSQCVSCQKLYRREHYEKNKQKYIDKAKLKRLEYRERWKEYKKTLKCNRCEENHPACLCFHHSDPTTKEHTVSWLVVNGSFKNLMKEIDKCEVLCANCHAKEHWSESFDM